MRFEISEQQRSKLEMKIGLANQIVEPGEAGDVPPTPC